MSHVDDGTIQAYLDHQLEFTELEARRAFEQHLADHPDDAARVEQARVIRERATGLLAQRDLGLEDIPPFEAIQERARATSNRKAQVTKLRTVRTLALAASVAAVFAVGWWVRPNLMTDQTAPVSAVNEAEPERANEPAAEAPAQAPQLADQDRQDVAPPADDRAVGFAELERDLVAEQAANRVTAPAASDARKATVEAQELRQQRSQVAGAAAGRGVAAAAPPPQRARRVAGEPSSRTLEGTVVDARTQSPLAGVRVIVTGTALTTTTDQEGRYRFTDVPAGRLGVRASSIGYEQEQITVDVDSAGGADIDIRLNASQVALDEMVVTGAVERERLADADSIVRRVSIRDSLRVAARDPAEVFRRAAQEDAFADWNNAPISDAERLLGHPILAIEGLTIDAVGTLPSGLAAVSVLQRLQSGVSVGLLQIPIPPENARREDASRDALLEQVAGYPRVVVGGLLIIGVADLPRDSLETLLGNLREAPRTN